jgi:hypothetical protein
MHIPRYISPRAVHFPTLLSEFQSTTVTEYTSLAQTLMPSRRWDMELGSCFLRYAQHTEASLLQCFLQAHATVLHPPTHFHFLFRVAASSLGDAASSLGDARGLSFLPITTPWWRHATQKKKNFWVQSLRTLRPWLMQQPTKVAAHLLWEN